MNSADPTLPPTPMMAEAQRLRAAGLTWSAIGAQLRVGRSRVGTLLKEADARSGVLAVERRRSLGDELTLAARRIASLEAGNAALRSENRRLRRELERHRSADRRVSDGGLGRTKATRRALRSGVAA